MRRSTSEPTTLDLLYRFFRHENPYTSGVLEAVTGITQSPIAWNVASGTMEETTRLYRVVYKEGDQTVLEEEVSYTVGDRIHALIAFYNRLVDCVGNDRYARDFQQACLDILEEDPWLVHIRTMYAAAK